MGEDPLTENPRRRWLRRGVKLGFALLLVGFVAILLPGLWPSAPDPGRSSFAVDLGGLAPGEARVFEWAGRPVWVLRRSAAQQQALAESGARLRDPDSRHSRQPAWARNPWRSRSPEWGVLIGLGTHLGCPLRYLPPAPGLPGGGLEETCGGSRYDSSGRVYRDQPAERNLSVPEHRVDGERLLLVH